MIRRKNKKNTSVFNLLHGGVSRQLTKITTVYQIRRLSAKLSDNNDEAPPLRLIFFFLKSGDQLLDHLFEVVHNSSYFSRTLQLNTREPRTVTTTMIYIRLFHVQRNNKKHLRLFMSLRVQV